MQKKNIYTFINDFCNGVFKSKYHIFDQDFIQDSVLNIYTQFQGSKSKIVNINKWLNGSIYNKFCNYCNRPKDNVIRLDEINNDITVEKLNNKSQSELLTESISNLPLLNTQILTLRVYGGYSYSEISDQLSMTESAVRKNYSRSLEKLRSEMLFLEP